MKKKIPKDKSLTLKLFKSSKKLKTGIIFASVFSAIAIACSLIAPNILGNLIGKIDEFWRQKVNGDANGAQELLNSLSVICILLLALYTGNSLSYIIKTLIMNNSVSRYFTCSLRIKISDKVKYLPISYLSGVKHGELISRMTHDVSVMGNTIHYVIDLIIQGAIQITAISIIMFTVNTYMALVTIIVLPISIIAASIISHKADKHFSISHREFGNYYSLVEESYGGFQTLKAFNMEENQRQKQKVTNDKIIDADTKSAYYIDIVQPSISFLNNVAYILICLIGGLLAINGTFAVSEMAKIIMYSKLFSAPLDFIANGISQMQRAKTASKRIGEILDEKEMPMLTTSGKFSGKGEVKFDNVCFSYDKDKPLIKDLSFYASSGQKIAIVGPTGAGKTTLVNLLMRFYDIDSGTITIDGIDISSVMREDVRRLFAMVLQETWMFNGTIKDNIRYGNPEATDEEVIRASVEAYCDFFIKQLPDSYDTIVDEHTTLISGGQKQLITIARAILSNRPLLILDEATSNVDTRTEILLQKAMDRLMQDKTCFVIAHRLSTIINSDIILVVKNGEIVEKGTHKELYNNKGFYFELYNSQYNISEKI